jgi:hypothetical protein
MNSTTGAALSSLRIRSLTSIASPDLVACALNYGGRWPILPTDFVPGAFASTPSHGQLEQQLMLFAT